MPTSPVAWRRMGVRDRSLAWPGAGTGYGTDGRLWGGEFLVTTYAHFERLAHLEEVPLPGGEQAIRQPWRVAAAYLSLVYGEAMESLHIDFVQRLARRDWRVLRQMLARGLNAPLSSSAGRLFNAVAALVGLRNEVQYEAQAAMELEMLAAVVGGRLRLPHPPCTQAHGGGCKASSKGSSMTCSGDSLRPASPPNSIRR